MLMLLFLIAIALACALVAEAILNYLATATNAIDHAVERRVLLIDWVVRVHQVVFRWHLIGVRLAMSHRCLRQRLLV